LSKKNEKIIDEILNERKYYGLGDWSQETGFEDKVKQLLINTLDKLDENFNMNASKKESNVASKEDFENHIISLISSLNDIIYVDSTDGTQNQFTEYFKSNKTTRSFYTSGSSKNDLGVIPKNVIVIDGNRLMMRTLILQ